MEKLLDVKDIGNLCDILSHVGKKMWMEDYKAFVYNGEGYVGMLFAFNEEDSNEMDMLMEFCSYNHNALVEVYKSCESWNMKDIVCGLIVDSQCMHKYNINGCNVRYCSTIGYPLKNNNNNNRFKNDGSRHMLVASMMSMLNIFKNDRLSWWIENVGDIRKDNVLEVIEVLHECVVVCNMDVCIDLYAVLCYMLRKMVMGCDVNKGTPKYLKDMEVTLSPVRVFLGTSHYKSGEDGDVRMFEVDERTMVSGEGRSVTVRQEREGVQTVMRRGDKGISMDGVLFATGNDVGLMSRLVRSSSLW